MNRDEHAEAVRCARCGRYYDEHPGGYCPDQTSPQGWAPGATAEEYRPPEQLTS